jgi:hypothetical protein
MIPTGSTTTNTLYFNSGSNTACGVTAYLLDTDYTNTLTTITSSQAGSLDVTYGFRVYVVTSNTSMVELTSGVQATIALSSNTTDQAQATWTCPTANIVLGYQSLKVDVYEKYGSGSWLSRASFITPVLITKQVVSSTWTFNLYINYTQTSTNTYSGFLFGNSNYRSTITGVTFSVPSENDIQGFRMGSGDVIGFIIGSYVDKIGVGAYLLVLLALTGALYFNYRHLGVIVFIFAIFGGSGGVVWILVPPIAAAAVDVLLLVAIAALLYKVTRG